MINYIKILVIELKSVQATMEILFDEANENSELNQRQLHTNVNTSRERVEPDLHNVNSRKESNEWHVIRAKKKCKKNENSDIEVGQPIPIIVNRFTPLEATVGESDLQKHAEEKKYVLKMRNSKEVGKNKIVLVGDSHVRNYASHLLNQLDRKFEVRGVVMPGARLQNIVQACEQEVKLLTKNDTIIIWGGSWDIAKNKTDSGLKHLNKLMSMNKNMNTILITAPSRYDLMESSCVNEEIKVFNRKLHKIMKRQSNVKILKCDLDRSCFTRHGLHLNRMGKNKMSERIIKVINDSPVKRKDDAIILKWKYDPEAMSLCQRASNEGPESAESQRRIDEKELDKSILKTGENIVQEEETPIEASQLEALPEREQQRRSGAVTTPTDSSDKLLEREQQQRSEEVEIAAGPPQDLPLPEREQQHGTRASNRKRKPPMKLSKDFL
jgi:hypothetical protein